MDAWMTSQRKVVLIRKRALLMCLAYSLTCNPWVFVQPGIDRRPVDRCRNYMTVLYPATRRKIKYPTPRRQTEYIQIDSASPFFSKHIITMAEMRESGRIINC